MQPIWQNFVQNRKMQGKNLVKTPIAILFWLCYAGITNG